MPGGIVGGNPPPAPGGGELRLGDWLVQRDGGDGAAIEDVARIAEGAWNRLSAGHATVRVLRDQRAGGNRLRRDQRGDQLRPWCPAGRATSAR